MRTVKIQIKRDEVSKDTKNHLKFKKKLRKVLMQRDENKFIAEIIDDYLNGFADFDPLLDWKFRPVCGCEIEGMDELCFNLKHNNLFGNKGFLLNDFVNASCCADDDFCEGYEMWLLDDMRIVFTYFCMMSDPIREASMIYRYPLGKKIPTDMVLDAEDFLDELDEEIYSLRHAE